MSAHAQSRSVQTPVQTSREQLAYLQVGSNPVCAFLSHEVTASRPTKRDVRDVEVAEPRRVQDPMLAAGGSIHVLRGVRVGG